MLEMANRQNRIIITFDIDFGNLVVRQKLKTKGIILLRFKPKSAQHITDTIVSLLRTRTPKQNRFIVVKEYSIRVLPTK